MTRGRIILSEERMALAKRVDRAPIAGFGAMPRISRPPRRKRQGDAARERARPATARASCAASERMAA